MIWVDTDIHVNLKKNIAQIVRNGDETQNTAGRGGAFSSTVTHIQLPNLNSGRVRCLRHHSCANSAENCSEVWIL